MINREQLDKLTSNIFFTDDELAILKMLPTGKSIQEISYELGICSRSVDRRIQSIKKKISLANFE